MEEDRSRDERDLESSVRAFYWGKWMSKWIGVWPLAPNFYLFNVTFAYFTAVMLLEYVDLFFCLPNFEKVLDNLTESLSFTIIYVRTFTLRVYNYKLGNAIRECLKDSSVSAFANSKEIDIFVQYTKEGKFFAKFVIAFTAMTEASWYLRPITSHTAIRVIADNETLNNVTLKFSLPFHFYVFYEINSIKTYALTYLSHGPFVPINGFGSASANCFLIALSFHISGRLAVLAERINRLNDNPDLYKRKLKLIIDEHIRLLRMVEDVQISFGVNLLVHLLNGTILLCIVGYQILLTLTVGPRTNIMPLIIYIMTLYMLMSIVCILSENLIAESNKVCEAFWNCGWYDMPRDYIPPDCISDVYYCIARSQKPLALTAGKFLTFGYGTITDVTRTAFRYLSVLRNFLLLEE
ncbi:putative odorant receptor 85d [Microplitis mediator]|uniref:putative odorant receptor 85d n=1 Tax=Microplitis mediator TaxID=375433 RepID=UPI0025539E0A|nr:putative odorant receptor 85d [Microplitis mediator]